MTYKNEINKMKQMISELRFQHSQSNEEMLKYEIESLKQELNKKKLEIQNLKQEKQSMMNKLSLYEKNMNETNNNHKIFREQTDKRFAQYQKEIEYLRKLSQERNTKDKLFIEKKEEIKKEEKINNTNINNDIKIEKEKKSEEEEEIEGIKPTKPMFDVDEFNFSKVK